MARWLFKTEPSEYSFERLVIEKKTVWDGVTNALALIHLRSVRKGDAVAIYHTGDARAAVGLARVITDPYPDPKLKDSKLVVVEVAADRRFVIPVPLDAIKKSSRFKGFDLIRNGRLSIVPVPDPMWDELLRMAS